MVASIVSKLLEEIRGTAKSETIYGTEAADKIIAGAGNDTIYGNLGDDILYGGTGADKLYGDGVSGNYGSPGSDTFLYKSVKESTVKAPDIIMEWDHSKYARDVIDLRPIDARPDYSGNQPFKWMGTKAFDGKPGELRYQHKNGDTYITADLDGDRQEDFFVRIDGKIKMYADDFLL